jgi:hypothetical protein
MRSSPTDFCTSEDLGFHAALRGTRLGCHGVPLGCRLMHEEPLREENGVTAGTDVPQSKGAPFISYAFRYHFNSLGIKARPSWVMHLNGNGSPERFMRTLPEQLHWLQQSQTADQLNQGVPRTRRTRQQSLDCLAKRVPNRRPVPARIPPGV